MKVKQKSHTICSAFPSLDFKNFKNVIVENIPWALFRILFIFDFDEISKTSLGDLKKNTVDILNNYVTSGQGWSVMKTWFCCKRAKIRKYCSNLSNNNCRAEFEITLLSYPTTYILLFCIFSLYSPYKQMKLVKKKLC